MDLWSLPLGCAGAALCCLVLYLIDPYLPRDPPRANASRSHGVRRAWRSTSKGATARYSSALHTRRVFGALLAEARATARVPEDERVDTVKLAVSPFAKTEITEAVEVADHAARPAGGTMTPFLAAEESNR